MVKSKKCELCGVVFHKPPVLTYRIWEARRFCSKTCASRASGNARRKVRPEGWVRDRSKEKGWAEISVRHHTRLSHLCAKARVRAKKHSLPCDIDTAHLLNLWAETGGRCVLTGRPFDLTAWGQRGHTGPNAPSLDRIVPALGYVKGNVRLIIMHMNYALASFGDDELRKLCADFLAFGRDDEW